MSYPRIKLTSSFRSRLFENTLIKNDLTLYELSKKLGCGYSGIKNWRKGYRLIPENIFDSLLDISSKEIKNIAKKNIIQILPANWGTSLGGKNTFNAHRETINEKMKYVRSFRLTKLEVPDVNEEIWELVGIILGDGCLSRYFSNYDKQYVYEVILTGNMTDDLQYYVQRIIPIIRSQFKSKANYRFRPSVHTIYLRIKSKEIFNFFRNLGVPVGKKKDKIRIINKIVKNNDRVRAAVLRGLLDTDGHIFARKDENYKYPYLEISSGSSRFLYDMKKLIRGFGLPAYIHDTNVLIRGGKNLKLWMEKIGSSHPIHINRYNVWLSTGRLLPKMTMGP